MTHLVVNESYSAIPLFRYSVFRVLQAPIILCCFTFLAKGWEILMEAIKTTKYFKVKVMGVIKDNLMCFSCYKKSYEVNNKHLDGIIE